MQWSPLLLEVEGIESSPKHGDMKEESKSAAILTLGHICWHMEQVIFLDWATWSSHPPRNEQELYCPRHGPILNSCHMHIASNSFYILASSNFSNPPGTSPAIHFLQPFHPIFYLHLQLILLPGATISYTKLGKTYVASHWMDELVASWSPTNGFQQTVLLWCLVYNLCTM